MRLNDSREFWARAGRRSGGAPAALRLLLAPAALDAVRRWVYEPTLLNGEPVELIATAGLVATVSATLPVKPASLARIWGSEPSVPMLPLMFVLFNTSRVCLRAASSRRPSSFVVDVQPFWRWAV